MAADNILLATNSMRSSLSSLKKKLSNLKVQMEFFDAEIEKIEGKFDNILTQTEIYKSKLEREMGREVRRLERELTLLSMQKSPENPLKENNEDEIRIAASVAIFESVLRLICNDADDFKLLCQAFLFPAVFERLMQLQEPYFLVEVPASAAILVERGREYLAWLRSEYKTHLTHSETWESAVEYTTEWWRNDALPLLYGCRDEQWDIDVPLSLPEMLNWRDYQAERPQSFPSVFDAYELYRKHKDIVYEHTSLRQFEIKHFSNN